MEKEEAVFSEPANSSGQATPVDPKPVTPERDEFVLGRRGILAFFTLSVLTLMVALDGTSISVALPIITQDLKGSAIEAFWSGTSFLLASTVFQPSFATLSGIFGRRPLVLVGLTLFFVGTVVCSVAKNFTYMLAGRSIQGIGGGGLMALSEVIVTDLVPLRQRGQYFGILSAMWSIGSVSGPILGGGFSQDVTWRWIFYINFPFIGVGAVAIILFLKLNIIPSSLSEKLRQIDYIGTFIFVGSLSSFLIPLTWGGILYDWSSWRTLVPLIIGIFGLLAFTIYESRYAKDPIIPPQIFQNRTASVSFAGSFLQGLVLWCLLYYQPLYYEAVKGYTPIMAGVALFPATFTVAPSAAAVGILVTKFGHYRWAIWLGWFLSTFGMGLLCYMDVDTNIPTWIFINIIPGIGLGLLFPSIGFAIQASATNDTLAIAVGMFSFFRAMGQAVGVAIGGVVFQNRMYHNLLQYPFLAARASEYSQDAAGLVQVIKQMAAGEEKLALQTAYTDSLRIVYAVSCGVCGAALLLSVFTESYDLNRALESKQGLRGEKNLKPDVEAE
ncbi:major facilitator superfamily domain-containing protein [Aspergillus cavernicola]|uniref:Major facilitator superfamily domain-containing protein n=1 Tax=Aspergillus cavernicola TaxID=176166 RepID=A0ABR4IRD4_9EURO